MSVNVYNIAHALALSYYYGATMVYLTIIPRAHVEYEMVDSQQGN